MKTKAKYIVLILIMVMAVASIGVYFGIYYKYCDSLPYWDDCVSIQCPSYLFIEHLSDCTPPSCYDPSENQGVLCNEGPGCYECMGGIYYYYQRTCTRTCEEECNPDWQCTQWSQCVGGTQSRTCTDVNQCGTNDGRPMTQRSCQMPDPCQGVNCGPSHKKCADGFVATCQNYCNYGACSDCNPDCTGHEYMCQGIVCDNYCSGGALYYDGACYEGTCEYQIMYCENGCENGQCIGLPEECPSCDDPTSWSSCTDGYQTRTIYSCSVDTDYQCVEKEETQSCDQCAGENVPEPECAQSVWKPYPNCEWDDSACGIEFDMNTILIIVMVIVLLPIIIYAVFKRGR